MSFHRTFIRIISGKGSGTYSSNKIFLAIVLQGGAMIEIDGKNHLIYTGTLIYLYPNHLVRQISHTEDLLLEYLWFEFEFLSDFPLLLKADISEYVGKILAYS